jgi:hypothetical protein
VPTYLVERYWPGVTSELLLEALKRGRRVMEEMRGEGMRLRHMTTILIPGEEVVFSVYEGPSTAIVRQLNERAGIPVRPHRRGNRDHAGLTKMHDELCAPGSRRPVRWPGGC